MEAAVATRVGEIRATTAVTAAASCRQEVRTGGIRHKPAKGVEWIHDSTAWNRWAKSYMQYARAITLCEPGDEVARQHLHVVRHVRGSSNCAHRVVYRATGSSWLAAWHGARRADRAFHPRARFLPNPDKCCAYFPNGGERWRRCANDATLGAHVERVMDGAAYRFLLPTCGSCNRRSGECGADPRHLVPIQCSCTSEGDLAERLAALAL
jgi:hypothetical protein